MARPRTFNLDEVLLVALDVFWRKGYQNTSLDDITAATGLSKPSLYAAYGDKASLFRKVLDQYHGYLLSLSEKMLAESEPAQATFEGWLNSLPPLAAHLGDGRGCLSVNSATDGNIEDAYVKDSIAAFNAALESLIMKRFERDRAQLPATFDAVAATRAILALYFGLMVISRQRPPPDFIGSVAAQVGKLLT